MNLPEKKYSTSEDEKTILDFWYGPKGICRRHLNLNKHPLGIYRRELDEVDAWFSMQEENFQYPYINKIEYRLDKTQNTEISYWPIKFRDQRTPENLCHVTLESKTYYTEYYWAPEYEDFPEEQEKKRKLALPLIRILNEKAKNDPNVVFGYLMPISAEQ